MSSDQTLTTRERYNLGSFLNDFGAWTGAIGFIITWILPYLRITTFESFLMKNLYITEKEERADQQTENDIK
jgi:hypothetical protein